MHVIHVASSPAANSRMLFGFFSSTSLQKWSVCFHMQHTHTHTHIHIHTWQMTRGEWKSQDASGDTVHSLTSVLPEDRDSILNAIMESCIKWNCHIGLGLAKTKHKICVPVVHIMYLIVLQVSSSDKLQHVTLVKYASCLNPKGFLICNTLSFALHSLDRLWHAASKVGGAGLATPTRDNRIYLVSV